MRYSKLFVPLLAFAVVACADSDGDEVEVIASEDSLAMEPAPMPEAGMDQPPGGMGQTAQLAALGDSGVEGEITIADRGDQTEVMVRLTGAPADSEHMGHIHSGTCDALGGVVQPLEAIETDATGTGTMTTDVELAPAEVMNGQHVVVYHGTGGRPITCGAIPAMTM